MLDVAGRGDEGAGILTAAGAIEVLAADPGDLDAAGAEPFGLVTCLGPLDRHPEPQALVEALTARLEAGGILILTVGSLLTAEATDADVTEPVRGRFAQVEVQPRTLLVGGAVGVSEPAAPGAETGARILAASDGELPRFEPRAALEDPAELAALFAALSGWEERARIDEAEAAATRWEARSSAEKLTATVNRIYELENTPLRRLLRRIRGGPWRSTHQGGLRRAAGPPERPPHGGG